MLGARTRPRPRTHPRRPGPRLCGVRQRAASGWAGDRDRFSVDPRRRRGPEPPTDPKPRTFVPSLLDLLGEQLTEPLPPPTDVHRDGRTADAEHPSDLVRLVSRVEAQDDRRTLITWERAERPEEPPGLVVDRIDDRPVYEWAGASSVAKFPGRETEC